LIDFDEIGYLNNEALGHKEAFYAGLKYDFYIAEVITNFSEKIFI
jgi:hypothetical protein